MKNLKYLFLLLVGMVLATACSDDDEVKKGGGKPVISVEGLASSAQYGDSIFFTVNCSDEGGVSLSTLKAYMEYSGEQVSAQVTRTKTEGAYKVALYAPLYKNVPDGNAQVRLVLQNIQLTKTEQVIDIAMSRPHYDHIMFIDSNGNQLTLTPSESDPYLFSGTYNSKNRTFKGHFVAPKVGDNGTEITFGQGNDDISEGVADEIQFNGNKGGNRVSFNTLTYAYTPTESDPDAATEIVFTKSDNVYVGELEQGHNYEFAGESIVNSSRWFYDTDWFTKNADGTYTFNAITGIYTIKADFDNLGFRIWTMKDETNSATLSADGSGAVWIIGNEGIGKPSLKANTVHGWWTGEDYDYCMAPISKNTYQITLTVGKQLYATDVNFKFFGQANWGIEFKGTAGDYHISMSSDTFIIGDGTNGHDDGNVYLADGAELKDGDTYVFTVVLMDGCSNGTLLVYKK